MVLFHLNIFIFGQVMAKIGAHAHIWAYIFDQNSVIFAAQEGYTSSLNIRCMFLVFLIYQLAATLAERGRDVVAQRPMKLQFLCEIGIILLMFSQNIHVARACSSILY